MARPRKTHCLNGHPLTGANLYVLPSTGQRCCVLCKKVSRAAGDAKRRRLKEEARAARIAPPPVSRIVRDWPLTMCNELPLRCDQLYEPRA